MSSFTAEIKGLKKGEGVYGCQGLAVIIFHFKNNTEIQAAPRLTSTSPEGDAARTLGTSRSANRSRGTEKVITYHQRLLVILNHVTADEMQNQVRYI